MSDASDPDEPTSPADTSGATNVADPKAIRRTRRKAAQSEDEQRLFWRTVFSEPIGRREMWGILESGHAFDERFPLGPTGFPAPEAATWCEAGEQRLAFRLYLSWLRLDPEGVALMLRENHPALKPPARAERG